MSDVIKPCVKCGARDRYANGQCRPCAAAYGAAYRAANGERRAAYYAANRERRRDHTLRRRYGIDQETYRELLDHQGGVCAICRKSPDPTRRAFAVDHCHATGFLRGILCGPCNKGVVGNRRGESGALVLARAADYLRNSPGLQLYPGRRVSERRPNGRKWAES